MNGVSEAHRAAEKAARDSYGRLLSILAMRDRDIAAAEDALSDALLSALNAWPQTGVPKNPDAWLLTAARNRQRNAHRAENIRQGAAPELAIRFDQDPAQNPLSDNRLNFMFICAHPAIDPAARAPLILQTVLGIDAATIAKSFLVEPATMSQRLVRAKARIRDAGIRFAMPSAEDMPKRLDAVLDSIYAAFSHGWDSLDIPDAPEALTGEAIWLARLVVEQMPSEPEPKGLLALMLYCNARRKARRDVEGLFVPLDRQDSRLWDRNAIIEAERLLTTAALVPRFGRFQCEAAIQSVHVQRAVTGHLNLRALRTLYDLLVTQSDSIGARIGRAVVIAEEGDTELALEELHALPSRRVDAHQPWWVARSRIAQLAGRQDEARQALVRALELTADPALRLFLEEQLTPLISGGN